MESLTRREWLGAAGAAASAAQARRPNILFILTDSWRGQVLPGADPNLIAPSLARLAKEGVNCTRTYTCYPVCCPSRAAMLTGKFPKAAGVRRNHSMLPMDQPTISATLKAAGYRTGYLGKWHLDSRDVDRFVPPERRRGFDYWAAHNVSHKHYGSVYFRDDAVPRPVEGFEPDFLTGLAIDFLRQPGGQPFYLYLALVAPHAPWTPPERHRAMYPPEGLRLRENVPEANEAKARRDLSGYYGLCTAVDDNVGRLLHELDVLGLRENTIVVFTADHGEMLHSRGMESIDVPWEETSRIPLLIRYPGKVRAGTNEPTLVSNVDYAPTLLGLCGVAAPAGMQGTNLAGMLTGRKRLRSRVVFAEGSVGQPEEWRMAVRWPYKLVTDAGSRPVHLFRLDRDPMERENLVDRPGERKTRDELAGLVRDWDSG